MDVEMNGRQRRQEAEKIAEELMALEPQIRQHTRLAMPSYIVLRKVTTKTIFCWSMIWAAVFCIALACVPEMEEGTPTIRSNILLGGFALVGFIGVVAFYRMVTKPKGLAQYSWSNTSLERLRDKLEFAKLALSGYEDTLRLTEPMVEALETLRPFIEEMDGILKIEREKAPFKVRGRLLREEFEYELNAVNCELILEKVACVYYGREHIQEFKDLLRK